MSRKKKKYYVVWEGHVPGVYDTWDECKRQIDGFAGAKYKSFPSREEAEAAYDKSPFAYIGKKESSGQNLATRLQQFAGEIERQSICVDAARSSSTGIMEYQGVETFSGRQIFHAKFPTGTNNIGEFLALVHALAMLEKSGFPMTIYTDSVTAMSWVRNKHAKTTMEHNEKTKNLMEIVHRAEKWLEENKFRSKIRKWKTDRWGEIPADFGRKKT